METKYIKAAPINIFCIQNGSICNVKGGENIHLTLQLPSETSFNSLFG